MVGGVRWVVGGGGGSMSGLCLRTFCVVIELVVVWCAVLVPLMW